MSASEISRWQRIVIKVGTSTLTAGQKRLNPPRMVDLCRQIAVLRSWGADVVLVTSGAQQAGRERLGNGQEESGIPYKQMLAAIGQGRIMQFWEQYFELYEIIVGQVLLTREDIEDRKRYLSVRDTFETLLKHGIVPVVNENDAVATDEIKVGENDSLSALVANLIGADLLVLLTDIDGLYSADPSVSPEAELIGQVEVIDESIYALASGSRSGLGTGGMYTKILAADIATHSGTSVLITNGGRDGALLEALADQKGTWFPATITPSEGRKRWLLTQKGDASGVIVDDGAAKAIKSGGTSLLAVGVKGIVGSFERGSVIAVHTGSGGVIARGLANYSATDVSQIAGKRSGDIQNILGYDYGPEIVHCDNMILL